MSYQHLTFWDTIRFNPLGVFYCKLQVSKRHITCAINISNFRLMRSLLVFISSIHEHMRGGYIVPKHQIRFVHLERNDWFKFKKFLVFTTMEWWGSSPKWSCFDIMLVIFLSQVMPNEQWGCETSLWLRTICTPHNL